jgi:hypothetical protein
LGISPIEVNCRNIEHEFNVWANSKKINWRIFAKEVSPIEFRTRFPSPKAIEELAHFGKLFMKTVPGAIILLEKWDGDIQPISMMEEAWFRVKGIPMNFRNRSTIFYAASLVGKPLALDKNFLRNFSYVRVKLGARIYPWSQIQELLRSRVRSMNFRTLGSYVSQLLLLIPELWWLILIKVVMVTMELPRDRELAEMILMQGPSLVLQR